jgi:membrane-bound ClpP family serine protease
VNIKRNTKDWLIVMVCLLDEVVVAALVLLALWYFKIKLPVPVIIVLVLLLGALVFLTYRVIVPSFHRKQVTGREAMVGLEGTVTESLSPGGVVRVAGEYWQATSVGGNILVGEEIEVVTSVKLKLTVKSKEAK